MDMGIRFTLDNTIKSIHYVLFREDSIARSLYFTLVTGAVGFLDGTVDRRGGRMGSHVCLFSSRNTFVCLFVWVAPTRGSRGSWGHDSSGRESTGTVSRYWQYAVKSRTKDDRIII